MLGLAVAQNSFLTYGDVLNGPCGQLRNWLNSGEFPRILKMRIDRPVGKVKIGADVEPYFLRNEGLGLVKALCRGAGRSGSSVADTTECLDFARKCEWGRITDVGGLNDKLPKSDLCHGELRARHGAWGSRMPAERDARALPLTGRPVVSPLVRICSIG